MQYKILSQTTNTYNEDRAQVILRQGFTIFIVADGAGGTGCGNRAAQNTIDYISDMEITKLNVKNPRYWETVITDIDSYLISQNHGGETTVVIVAVCDNVIYGASVGDSSAWLIKEKDQIVDITTAQVRKPLVGCGRVNPTGFGSIRMEGFLLLASDGLTNYITLDKVTETVMKHGIDAGFPLVDLVRLPSGNLWDDITVIIAKG
ncbi:protein phosphatase 2C domain-containing protein [Candidatus Uabimicrobium amorphum]|uniref:Protein phosphatase PhpP n=1 Tax=Uabimicrobium amorphum TaxID=2596890 RepID=A0A5S9F1C0_UABAM|nr:protein phosphatase 2C domain-containing protein [Candidatus Uabimicrobium amorphum]BBM82505.1 protein phosphatase PhpP [Candidatus Uabimicrobium amorphum]